MDKQTTALTTRAKPSAMQTNAAIKLSDYVDSDTASLTHFDFISNPAMKMGTNILAGVGSGKSTLLAELLYQQLIQEKSAVIFDPTGGAVDSLLDKILRLPPEYQERLFPRIMYVCPGDEAIIFPSPLIYPISKKDTFFKMANRFPAVLKRNDPELSRAPILGLNSLIECANYADQIAAATGQQIDFVADLIDHPGKYRALLRQVLADYPQLQPAVEYFRRLMDPTASRLKEKNTSSFKNKLFPFLADPTRMATYAAKINLLDWTKLLKARKIILIDYRSDTDADHLQFDMIWHFKGFTDAIKQRGMAGRGQECLCIIDEITSMLGQHTYDGRSLLAEDLQELITRLGRAYGVNTVIAYQGLYQLDERIQNLFMSMGNQLVGQLSISEDAERVAKQFLRYNPYKVKKTENIWHTMHPPAILSYFGGPSYPYPQVIDTKTIEFTLEEQVRLWTDKIHNLGQYQFYAQIATGEGGKKGPVKKIRIANPDKRQFPQEEMIAPLRQLLARRDGIPLEKLLAEMQANRIEVIPEKKVTTPKHPKNEPATMEKRHDPRPTQPTQSVSHSGAPSDDSGSATAGSSGSADFWEAKPATKDDSTHGAG